jgi:mycofactocin precursor
MTETMTQEPVLEPTAAAPSIETDDEALAEPLIEEISIDGMCGVY